MAYFQTKNPNVGKFLRDLQCEDIDIFYGHLVYFTAIWYILWPFGILCGPFVYFEAIWYRYFIVIWCIFPRFGMLYKEKSCNPGSKVAERRIYVGRNEICKYTNDATKSVACMFKFKKWRGAVDIASPSRTRRPARV
jgi:hypothetical protein